MANNDNENKPKTPPSLEQQMRQRALDTQRKVDAILKKNLRLQDKNRQKPPEASPDGISPAMRVALMNAQKKVEQSPAHKQIIDRAETLRRIEQVRKQLNMDNIKPAPETEFGRPIQPVPSPTPTTQKTVAQELAEKREKGTLSPPSKKKSNK
jgi:hypothetical protein